jgi:methylated-DNA-protein-cysteine methyltransferase-like protein
LTELQARIRAAVLELQPGEVVSYGEVARRAGSPGRARAVGAFLAEFGDGLPWWRVVHRNGTLAAPDPRAQRRALEAEGVEVTNNRVIGGIP